MESTELSGQGEVAFGYSTCIAKSRGRREGQDAFSNVGYKLMGAHFSDFEDRLPPTRNICLAGGVVQVTEACGCFQSKLCVLWLSAFMNDVI